jgi:hypothetical protein
MGIQPLAVHTHRNPLEVATSLVERDLMDRAYGEFLWLCHVIEAEHGSRQLPRAFTSYDRLLKNWVPEVRRLSKALGLTWPRFTAANASAHENFVEPKLRHFVSDPGAVLKNDLLSDWIRDTFSILENWAADGASAADYPKLDAVRRQYISGALAFGPLVHSRGKAILKDRDNVRRKLAETEAALVQSSAETAQAVNEIEKLSASRMDLEGQLTQRAEAISKLTEERDAEFARLREENEGLSDLCGDLEAGLAQARDELLELEEQTRREIARLSADVARYREESERANSLRSELVEARQALMRSHGTIDDTAKALSRLAGTLGGTSAGGAPDLAAGIKRLEAGVESLLAERARAIEQLRRLSAEKEAMINSRSWRITAPLRAIQRKSRQDSAATNPPVESHDAHGTT